MIFLSSCRRFGEIYSHQNDVFILPHFGESSLLPPKWSFKPPKSINVVCRPGNGSKSEYSILLLRYDGSKYGCGQAKGYHAWGLTIIGLMIAQLASGLSLSALLAYRLGHTYSDILELLHEGWLLFLLRDIHMLGANTLALTIYLHSGKAAHSKLLSLVRLSIWLTGSLLFLLLLAACFTGYVLVNGNMSYWALIVILNIVTVLPLLDSPIVATLLSSTVPTDTSVHRMFTLHYLLALLFAALMLLHLVYVHRLRPGSTHNQNIRSFQIADVLIKDLVSVLPMIMLFSLPYVSRVIHPDNWGSLSTAKTPPHIEPEIYFLWLFAVLKSRSQKTIGALMLALFIVFLFLLPFFSQRFFSSVIVIVISSFF